MKIIVAAEPIENGAGLAMFLLDTVETLSRSRPGWRFTLLALSEFSDAADLENLPNVRVVFCDRQGWRGAISRLLPAFRGRERLFNFLAERTPTGFLKKQFGSLEETWKNLGPHDAVWVPHFAISQNRWPALYKPGTIKSPVLLTIHDLHPAVFPEEWKTVPDMLDNFWKVFQPFAQRAGAVITHSNYQRQSIIEHFKIGPEKISVAYLPLPQNELLTRQYSESETNRILEGYNIHRPYIFCPMSQIAVHKNHFRSITAWSILRKMHGDNVPQLVFTNYGHAQDLERFREVVKKEDLTGKVIFTGKTSREELATLYRASQAVLSPTLYEGGGSGPVMEAVTAGRPVLCSDIPPIREQMSRFGLSAIYFDPCKPEDIARAVTDFILGRIQVPINDPWTIRQRLPRDREELARAYTESFLRITGNL